MLIPWDSFLARYRPLARNLAAGITGRLSEADDVVQEAALALWKADQDGTQRFTSVEHARNYFLRSVRNLALKARERSIAMQAPMQALDEAVHVGADTTGVDDALSARQAALASAMAALSPDERDLLRRRYIERETLASIAQASGVAISTLHSREQAMLEKLRKWVTKEEDRA